MAAPAASSPIAHVERDSSAPSGSGAVPPEDNSRSDSALPNTGGHPNIAEAAGDTSQPPGAATSEGNIPEGAIVDDGTGSVGGDRLTAGLKAPLILIGVSGILILTVYWTASNWTTIDKPRGLQWNERQCRVAGKDVKESVVNQWRSEIYVDGFTKLAEPIPEQLPALAFRYGDAIYNHTKEEALKFNERFDINQSYPCWVLPRTPVPSRRLRQEISNNSTANTTGVLYKISMNPMHIPTVENIDLALVSTCIAIVMLAVFMVALLYTISIVDPYDPNPQPENANTGTVIPNALSEAQITQICAIAADTALRDPESVGLLDCGWDCAICLDGDGTTGKLAQLMCKHTFHLACIKSWLLRGGVTCPLCNFRLRPVDEAAYSKKLSQDEESVTEAGAREREEDQTAPPFPDIAIALMGLASPPEPIYRAPVETRNNSVSSGNTEGSHVHETGAGSSAENKPVVDVGETERENTEQRSEEIQSSSNNEPHENVHNEVSSGSAKSSRDAETPGSSGDAEVSDNRKQNAGKHSMVKDAETLPSKGMASQTHADSEAGGVEEVSVADADTTLIDERDGGERIDDFEWTSSEDQRHRRSNSRNEPY